MMQKKYNLNSFIAIAILTVAILSCNFDKCLDGSGSKSEKIVQTGYFKEANVNGIFEVWLVQDTAYYIAFEGGDNLLEQVSASNTDSVLWLDNSNTCYFMKDYEKVKLFLHFNKVDIINLRESCTLRSLNPITSVFTLTSQEMAADIDIELNNEHFFFYNHKTSGGKFIFRGNCTNCSFMAFYTGKIDASKLVTKNIYFENHSVVDCSVRASETIHAQIFSNGNILVYGNPAIYLDSLQGSGKVIEVKEN